MLGGVSEVIVQVGSRGHATSLHWSQVLKAMERHVRTCGASHFRGVRAVGFLGDDRWEEPSYIEVGLKLICTHVQAHVVKGRGVVYELIIIMESVLLGPFSGA